MAEQYLAIEPTAANTRHPQLGCRVAVLLCSLIVACLAASGEETGCEQVPESRRAQCLKVMTCMVVEDHDVRRACIEAAQRQSEQPEQAEQQAPSRQPIAGERRQTSRPTRDQPATQDVQWRQPPNEFSAEVSRIYQSILDRQLIALDSAYLFESDRAAQARLKVGERVEVVKVSSRFRYSGRRWQITGPSRTPIAAYRIRCERETIRADDRRKCAQMLDR